MSDTLSVAAIRAKRAAQKRADELMAEYQTVLRTYRFPDAVIRCREIEAEIGALYPRMDWTPMGLGEIDVLLARIDALEGALKPFGEIWEDWLASDEYDGSTDLFTSGFWSWLLHVVAEDEFDMAKYKVAYQLTQDVDDPAPREQHGGGMGMG